MYIYRFCSAAKAFRAQLRKGSGETRVGLDETGDPTHRPHPTLRSLQSLLGALARSRERPLPSQAAMLHHQAAILDHLNPRLSQPLRRNVISDAELKPHGLGTLGDDVIDVHLDVLRPPKNLDQVQLARHIDESTVHRSAENLLDLGEINRDRDDLKT